MSNELHTDTIRNQDAKLPAIGNVALHYKIRMIVTDRNSSSPTLSCYQVSNWISKISGLGRFTKGHKVRC